MNKTKIIPITIGTMALVLGIGSFAGTTYAYRGNPNVQGPNCSPEKHEAMIQAIENNDYSAWATLMEGRGKITEVITQENFAKFVEMHKLMLEGKTEEANQIRQELGLGLGRGHRGSQGFGWRNKTSQ